MSEPLNNNDPTKHFLHRRTLWIGFIIVILLLGMGGLYWKKAMSQPSEEYSQWDKPVLYVSFLSSDKTCRWKSKPLVQSFRPIQ